MSAWACDSRTTNDGRFWFSRAEAVTEPRAHARPARLLEPGLDERDRRVVIDRIRVHRLDDGDVVDDLRGVRQQLADPGAGLPVLRELVDRLRHGQRATAPSSGRRADPCGSNRESACPGTSRAPACSRTSRAATVRRTDAGRSPASRAAHDAEGRPGRRSSDRGRRAAPAASCAALSSIRCRAATRARRCRCRGPTGRTAGARDR